jgi:hypothetical protein
MDRESNARRLVEVRAAIAEVIKTLTAEEFGDAAQTNTENGGGCHIVIVPAAFWNDHTSRDLDFVSVEVRSSSAEWGNYDDGSYVVLVMGDDELNELARDAAHYSTGFGEDYEPLAESARRTIVALWLKNRNAVLADAYTRAKIFDLEHTLGLSLTYDKEMAR